MLLDPYDVLDQLAEFIDSTLTWCDQNGEFDTGMHSFSDESIIKMRRCVDAAIKAFAQEKLVKFSNDMDATAYLSLRVGGKPEIV